jgi:hydroxyacylglutathione hydrolase
MLTILSGEGTGNNYAYLVTDDKTKQAVIIDPANPSESVLPLHLKYAFRLTQA